MVKKIIGLVGETGSGKDTACSIIKEKEPHTVILRFSKPLTDALGIFFNEIKKEDQQWLASALRDRFGEDILMQGIAKKIEKTDKEKIVLNGIRVKEEFDFIKSLGGIVVYITAPPETRWKRVVKRGEKGDDGVLYEKFLEIDKGRPEMQIKKIGERADTVIKNEGDVRDLEKKVTQLIKNL